MDSITDSVSALREKKRATFEKLMRGDHILLHMDSTRDGVIVPSHLEGNPALILKLSYNFQGITQHDENGITANLVFSGRFYECVIPWDSIWGMTDEKRESSLWRESLPKDVLKVSSSSVGAALHMEVKSEVLGNSANVSTNEKSKDSESTSTNRKEMRKAILRRVK